MADGFGTAAREWAARLPEKSAWIASDFNRVPAALACAVREKRAGKSIAATVFLPDTRSLIAARNGAAILTQIHTYDERAILFAGLAGETLVTDGVAQVDWIKLDTAMITATGEFLSSCDLWVTRSETETQRIAAIVGYLPDTILSAAPLDPRVPAPPPPTAGSRSGVVVWAPYATREECAVLAFGLEPLRLPVTILCRAGGPPLGRLRACFETASESAALLAHAAVIVDGSSDDPGSALALARFGVPLVVSCTSGAHEWLRPVTLYRPWAARSVFDAVATALGGRTPHPTRADDGVATVQRELDGADHRLPTTGPLVSIVVPTYNRRARLRGALRSVADQRYRTVEIVVVNDGGEDIADIVADFPTARLIESHRNLGVTHSINAGVAAARGEYLGFLADDDFLQPDHVARLVDALEQSGLDIAHSKEVALHYDVGTDGSNALRGHHIGAPSPTYPDEMLVSNRIGGPSMMIRRRALDAAGPFDTDMRHGSDFEMWMRLSQHHDFVFVNHVTAQVSMRNDGSQLSSVSGAETAGIMRRIYAKHPVPGRTPIQERRNSALVFCAGQSVVRSGPVAALGADDLADLQTTH